MLVTRQLGGLCRALRVGGDEVEEGDAEANARIQRETGRCIREAEDAGQEAMVRASILPSPIRRERSRDKSTVAWTKATRSGARWLIPTKAQLGDGFLALGLQSSRPLCSWIEMAIGPLYFDNPMRDSRYCGGVKLT